MCCNKCGTYESFDISKLFSFCQCFHLINCSISSYLVFFFLLFFYRSCCYLNFQGALESKRKVDRHGKGFEWQKKNETASVDLRHLASDERDRQRKKYCAVCVRLSVKKRAIASPRC